MSTIIFEEVEKINNENALGALEDPDKTEFTSDSSTKEEVITIFNRFKEEDLWNF